MYHSYVFRSETPVQLYLFRIGDARWRGYSRGEVLRQRGRVQRYGHGTPWSQPGRLVQLL